MKLRNMKDFGVPDYIMHFGIKGQKWGIRRYQNPDGSLTPEGQQHYGYQSGGSRFKTYAKRAALVGGAALAGYGAYRYAKKNRLGRKLIDGYRKTVGKTNASRKFAKGVNNLGEKATAAYADAGRKYRKLPPFTRSVIGNTVTTAGALGLVGLAAKHRPKWIDRKANEINRRRREKQNREISERGISRKQYNDEQRRKTARRARMALGAAAVGAIGADLYAHSRRNKQTYRHYNRSVQKKVRRQKMLGYDPSRTFGFDPWNTRFYR